MQNNFNNHKFFTESTFACLIDFPAFKSILACHFKVLKTMKYNWLSYPWRVMLVSFQFNFSETKTVTVFSLESILAKLTNVNVGNTRICSSGSRFKLTSFPLQIWSVSLVDLQVDAKGPFIYYVSTFLGFLPPPPFLSKHSFHYVLNLSKKKAIF